MESIDQAALHQACRALLKPITSFLMKCGMTYREFADISKSAFVEVAGVDYGIRGRPTNVSRVSLLTGISRKEIKHQRELLARPTAYPVSKTTDATRVLSGWYQDADFLDDDGRPRVLELSGAGDTFSTLCTRYAGDIPVTTLLKELRRVDAVDEDARGRLRALRRFYMPTQFDPQWLMNAGGVLADLGNNLNHNLVADEDRPSHFLGRATEDTIDAAALPEFRDFIEEHGQALLELVDDWLTQRRDAGTTGKQVRLGLGLFLINGDSNLDHDPQ